MQTSDYLTQLQQDREDLVDNLEAKGITGLTGDETFTELVPKVLNIPSGVDLSEYFETEPTSISTTEGWLNNNYIKQVPTVTIPDSVTSLYGLLKNWKVNKIPKIIFNDNVTSLYNLFYNCDIANTNSIDFSGFNMANVTDMRCMFQGCANLKSVDLSNIDASNTTNINEMFLYDRALTFIDMRTFNFINATGNPFAPSPANGPANNCLIIVADETQKNALLNLASRMTNIQTVAEYEES